VRRPERGPRQRLLANPSPINVATKDTFGVFMLEQLIRSKSAAACSHRRHADVRRAQLDHRSVAERRRRHPFATRPPDATIESNIKTRSAEIKSIAVTFVPEDQ